LDSISYDIVNLKSKYFLKHFRHKIQVKTLLDGYFILHCSLLFSIFLLISLIICVNPVYATTNDIQINNISTTKGTNVSNSSYDLSDPVSSDNVKKVALIKNKFTYAAYQNGSFYNFYDMHSPEMFDRIDDDLNTTITENLNLLKNRPIPSGPFPFYLHPTYKDEPYIEYYNLIHDLLKNNNSTVSNLTDMDVDQGRIFSENGSNVFDLLIMFHNEYISQPEYDNLKKFVENGGTILFTEGNVLYAEVDYDPDNETITLVKGHNWEFNGTVAKNSVPERWLDENREWMGSNFLIVPSYDHLPFRFNPFNYNHTEEQYVTNPNAKILLNYEAYNLPDKYINATVATYEMQYGKGKVVHLGLWGHMVRENPVFVDYIKRVLIPLALGQNITAINDKFVNNASYYNTTNPITGQNESSLRSTQSSYDNGIRGPRADTGLPAPADQNTSVISPSLYVIRGNHSIINGDAIVSTFAQCNPNDLPLSGGYSIVRNDAGNNGEKIEQIESLPNIQNRSWMVNVGGEDIQVTPYVLCQDLIP
jgi:hypothetical protein